MSNQGNLICGAERHAKALKSTGEFAAVVSPGHTERHYDGSATGFCAACGTMLTLPAREIRAMLPDCTNHHELVKADSTNYLAYTERAPFGDRMDDLEIRNCERCHSTISRPWGRS